MEALLVPLTLAEGTEASAIVFIACGSLIAVAAIVTSGIKGVVKRREMEMSRRELAAYVAEGSITADEAERLLKADPTEE